MILSFFQTGFECPRCTCEHSEDDYYAKLERSKTGVACIKCKGCKTKICVVQGYDKVHVWLKNEWYEHGDYSARNTKGQRIEEPKF